MFRTSSRNEDLLDHRQVKRSQEHVSIGEGEEHGSVDKRLALVHLCGWLVGVTFVWTGNLNDARVNSLFNPKLAFNINLP